MIQNRRVTWEWECGILRLRHVLSRGVVRSLSPRCLVATIVRLRSTTNSCLLLFIMSMIGAISRTRPLLKPKREIPLAMTKWWKKKRPAEAEVRRAAGPPINNVSVLFGGPRDANSIYIRQPNLHQDLQTHACYTCICCRSPCISLCMNNMLSSPGSRRSPRRSSSVSLPTYGPQGPLPSSTACWDMPSHGIIPRISVTASKWNYVMAKEGRIIL